METVEAPSTSEEQEPIPEVNLASAPTETTMEASVVPSIELQPVEISFSYNGIAVTLTAPNFAGARWAGKYLQQLLADLEKDGGAAS